jgi:hypothetical protein
MFLLGETKEGVYFGMVEEDRKLSKEPNRIKMAMARSKCIV